VSAVPAGPAIEARPVESDLFDPQPYRSATVAATRPDTPLTRMVLARARTRGGLPIDTVTFEAGCPGCGRYRNWTQSRDDTQVISSIDCDCAYACD
jgi:hypothetical protein